MEKDRGRAEKGQDLPAQDRGQTLRRFQQNRAEVRVAGRARRAQSHVLRTRLRVRLQRRGSGLRPDHRRQEEHQPVRDQCGEWAPRVPRYLLHLLQCFLRRFPLFLLLYREKKGKGFFLKVRLLNHITHEKSVAGLHFTSMLSSMISPSSCNMRERADIFMIILFYVCD